jgi:hypothetical protein
MSRKSQHLKKPSIDSLDKVSIFDNVLIKTLDRDISKTDISTVETVWTVLKLTSQHVKKVSTP